jgi:hypothetical protein
MKNIGDYFYGVEKVTPSAPQTINTDTNTNFDFVLKDQIGAAVTLDVYSHTAGTAQISSIVLASDAGFSTDVTTYDATTNVENILKNDRESSTEPFAQTLLSAIGKRKVAFENIAKKDQIHCRVVVTSAGTANLGAQVIVDILKDRAPFTQA